MKYLEGRWYTLRDIERLARESPGAANAVLDEVEAGVQTRLPGGPAWRDYEAGARSAVADARAALQGSVLGGT